MQITPHKQNDDNTVIQIIRYLHTVGGYHIKFKTPFDKLEKEISFSAGGKRHKIKVRTDLPEYRIIELVNEEIKSLQLLGELT